MIPWRTSPCNEICKPRKHNLYATHWAFVYLIYCCMLTTLLQTPFIRLHYHFPYYNLGLVPGYIKGCSPSRLKNKINRNIRWCGRGCGWMRGGRGRPIRFGNRPLSVSCYPGCVPLSHPDVYHYHTSIVSYAQL